jgi:hypothetical protein
MTDNVGEFRMRNVISRRRAALFNRTFESLADEIAATVSLWKHLRLTNGNHKLPRGLKVGDCSPGCYRCQIERVLERNRNSAGVPAGLGHAENREVF